MFTEEDISRLSRASDSQSTGSRRRDELSLFHLILAIGAQTRGRDQRDLTWATQCFALARQAAFAGMLQDPTVDLVAMFLLMAFYMLGACHRNAAFMYIGVASKAAIILGLHVPGEYKNAAKVELNRR